MIRLLVTGCLFAVFSTLGTARECVHLASGFTLVIDSHEERDGFLVAKAGTGSMQIPLSDVSTIEALPDEITAGASTKTPETAEEILNAAAQAQGVEAAFVRSIAQVESGLRQNAVSRKGALGLMQLMPGTARELQVNPLTAEANALGGAKYLRQLLLQYKGDSGLALAAYNAGPGAVQRYKGIPPYPETRQYILKVLKEYQARVASGQSSSKLAQ